MNSTAQREAQYKAFWQHIFNSRYERWRTLLRDLTRTSNPDATVVRFPNASSYLFSTGRALWAVDPSYSAVKNYGEHEYEEYAAGMEQFEFILVTHCHTDHCDMRLLQRLAQKGRKIIVPSASAGDFAAIAADYPGAIMALQEGEAVTLCGITIKCYAGYHSGPGSPVYPAGSFLITLPDGVNIFMPVDVRDYTLAPPAGLPPIDYLFSHVWLGRDCSHHAEFPLVEDFCHFMLRFKPANIILAHLCEISRTCDSMWLPHHADLIRDRLRALSPRTTVAVPHFGAHLTLTREFQRDIFADWPQPQQEELLNNLGVAIKLESWPERMEEAVRHRTPLLEINGKLPDDTAPLAESIKKWRNASGRILSAHLPDIVPQNIDIEKFIATCGTFIALGIDRVTVHPPRCPVADFMASQQEIFCLYRRLLEPVMAANLEIGIENMHMVSNEPPDNRYRPGHLPDECLMFIEKLRETTGYEKIGFHFDIGHAANNHPFTEKYPPQYWLKKLAPLMNGMHVHQFDAFATAENPHPNGHRHVCGRTGGYPDLSPIYEAWQSGALRAHIFLEVSRGVESSPFPSLLRLRETFSHSCHTSA